MRAKIILILSYIGFVVIFVVASQENRWLLLFPILVTLFPFVFPYVHLVFRKVKHNMNIYVSSKQKHKLNNFAAKVTETLGSDEEVGIEPIDKKIDINSDDIWN